jgi:hypothetical protein
VKSVFKLQYSVHRARLAVGHATKAATLAIRAMLTCSHRLLHTTGANLDLRAIKSADLCHDYLGSRSNIQRSSKKFSLELPAPAYTPSESRLQQKVQTRQSGLRQGETRPSDRHRQLGSRGRTFRHLTHAKLAKSLQTRKICRGQ